MSKILIVYTGGTIGMVESEDRQTLVPYNFEHVLSQVPEIKKLEVVIESISFNPPLDSSDMHPGHWSSIASIIKTNYDAFDGFVVLHGSDTLAFTASALSFMLNGLRKPVILTGSQLPIGMIRTDARENLITAIQIATRTMNDEPVIQEVAIYFEFQLYRGNRTKKVSTDAFDAFDSPNQPVLAKAGVHIEFDLHELYRTTQSAFSMTDGFDPNVAILFLFPGICENHVRSTLEMPGLKAVILATFGSGNAPQKDWFLKALEKAIKAGVIVVNMTQCSKGKVEQGKYASSIQLLEMGVISGGDMTLEAALTKLMLLLGQRDDKQWVMEQFLTNQRGELSVK